MAGSLRHVLRELFNNEHGQDLAEYGIALGVIVAIVVSVAVFIGTDVNILWSNARTQIADVINGE